MYNNFFKNKKIFLTGHAGFKGAWLALILSKLGAEVTGFSKPPEGWDSIYDILNIGSLIKKSIFGNLMDSDLLIKSITEANPEIIFHLAAQPFVLKSYEYPLETWQTNVIGTLNVFEATKNLNNLRAILNVTTDKCYKNKEWQYSYRENDELGGHDPYSASKAAVEILSSSYRASFFKKRGVQLATARGGNVIGGGDFNESRLLPSVFYALKIATDLIIRNPQAIRPWQHVIDVLNGYIIIAKTIYEKDGYDEAYNIAPDNVINLKVSDIVEIIKQKIPQLNIITQIDSTSLHEACLLKLDNSFSKTRLGWQPLITNFEAINLTIDWYKNYLSGQNSLFEITNQQIENLIF